MLNERINRMEAVRPKYRIWVFVRTYWLFGALTIYGAAFSDRFFEIVSVALIAMMVSLTAHLVYRVVQQPGLASRLERSRLQLVGERGASVASAKALIAPSPRRKRRQIPVERGFNASLRRLIVGWAPLLALVVSFFVAIWGAHEANREYAREFPSSFLAGADFRIRITAARSPNVIDQVVNKLETFAILGESTMLKQATPGERMAYVLVSVDDEIANGGFEQLYSSSEGNRVPEAIVAARAIGATSYAQLLQDSTTVSHALLAKFDALWQERGFAPELRAYIRAHPAEFFR